MDSMKSLRDDRFKDKVKKGKDQASIVYLVEHFKWLLKGALATQAKIEGQKVVAIVDTGCSGVVVLQGCYERLELKEDDIVLFSMTMAENQ